MSEFTTLCRLFIEIIMFICLPLSQNLCVNEGLKAVFMPLHFLPNLLLLHYQNHCFVIAIFLFTYLLKTFFYIVKISAIICVSVKSSEMIKLTTYLPILFST